jgi:hypothetical protein
MGIEKQSLGSVSQNQGLVPVPDPTVLTTDQLRREVDHLKEIVALKEISQKDLALAEHERINAVTLAESRRIDALLTTSQTAVLLAAEKANLQADALAKQVQASADALRNQVSAAAAATSEQAAVLRTTLEARITTIEQKQYSGAGRDTQVDENRAATQWVIMAAFSALSILAVILTHFWK